MEFWQLEDQRPQSTRRPHGSSVFTHKEMEEATCSFSDDNLLGKGGFGKVYRGTLRSGEVNFFPPGFCSPKDFIVVLNSIPSILAFINISNFLSLSLIFQSMSDKDSNTY